MPPVSAPEAASRIIRRRFHCIIAADGWAIPIRLAILVAGCRKLGMNVIARTDPHATYQDVYDAHPDWIAVEASGNKRRHWASPELWVTCALGPYNFEFMTAVTREIVERYQVDGIFSNRWEGSGMCYCEHCQANFKQATGFDLPRTRILRTPLDALSLCGSNSVCSNSGVFGTLPFARPIPTPRFIANAGGGALSSLDMKTIGELAPTLFADRQARSGVAPPWTNGKNGKEYRATLGRKAIAGIFSVGCGGPISLEGFRAERGRDSSLGGGRDRQRFAALVYQVLRHFV